MCISLLIVYITFFVLILFKSASLCQTVMVEVSSHLLQCDCKNIALSMTTYQLDRSIPIYRSMYLNTYLSIVISIYLSKMSSHYCNVFTVANISITSLTPSFNQHAGSSLWVFWACLFYYFLFILFVFQGKAFGQILSEIKLVNMPAKEELMTKS